MKAVKLNIIEQKIANRMVVKSLTPILFLLLLAALFVAFYKIGIAGLISQNQKINKLENEIKTMTQKEALLKETQLQFADARSTRALAFALPDKNPAFSAIYQIKSLAQTYGLAIQGIKVGAEKKDDLVSRINLTIDVTGPTPAIVDFVKNLRLVSPLMNVQDLTLSSGLSFSSATFKIDAYWSAFPANLSSLTEPLTPLTAEEKILVNKINQLTTPTFMEILPEVGGAKTNPFD